MLVFASLKNIEVPDITTSFALMIVIGIPTLATANLASARDVARITSKGTDAPAIVTVPVNLSTCPFVIPPPKSSKLPSVPMAGVTGVLVNPVSVAIETPALSHDVTGDAKTKRAMPALICTDRGEAPSSPVSICFVKAASNLRIMPPPPY
jgi:hypothetical protein